eukprot:Platyproteum_vivax@DN6390_c1_g1_i1.p1
MRGMMRMTTRQTIGCHTRPTTSTTNTMVQVHKLLSSSSSWCCYSSSSSSSSDNITTSTSMMNAKNIAPETPLHFFKATKQATDSINHRLFYINAVLLIFLYD